MLTFDRYNSIDRGSFRVNLHERRCVSGDLQKSQAVKPIGIAVRSAILLIVCRKSDPSILCTVLGFDLAVWMPTLLGLGVMLVPRKSMPGQICVPQRSL